MFRIAFGGTVAAEKPVLEEYRYLRHYRIAVFVFGCGYLYGGQQILFGIRTQ